ncbi:MAG: hypothetical protein ABI548_16080 [Polyangiaceae bacterium]
MKRYTVLAACCGLAACGWWIARGTGALLDTSMHANAPLEGPHSRVTAPNAPPVSNGPSPLAPPLLDEPALMTELRRADARDPELALTLARDGNARFPESPDAPERTALAIKSLALTGHLSEARGEAEFMVNHYPASRWTEEVEQHTGAHPHRALAALP